MRVINKKSNDKVKLPKRGNALRTFNEKLVDIKKNNVNYDQLRRSVCKALSHEKHLFVEMIRVAV